MKPRKREETEWFVIGKKCFSGFSLWGQRVIISMIFCFIPGNFRHIQKKRIWYRYRLEGNIHENSGRISELSGRI